MAQLTDSDHNMYFHFQKLLKDPGAYMKKQLVEKHQPPQKYNKVNSDLAAVWSEVYFLLLCNNS